MVMTATDAGVSPTRQLNRWWFPITGFLTLLFDSSTVNVLFNVLGKDIADEFGWNRSVITNGFSVETILTGVSIVVLGVLVDRYGPRLPAIPMTLGFGGGLMLMAALPNSQTVFYLLCVLIGACAGALNPVAHATVVSAWFADRRGLALGVLMAGMGACGVLIPYLANFVFGLVGWRGTFLVVGALCTIIPTAVYLFVTRMPGRFEEERKQARAAGRTAGESLWSIARRSRQFWLLSAAIFLVSTATFGLMSQVVPMTTDKGIDRSVAVAVLSVLSLSSVFARLLVGYLLDRVFAPLIGSIIFALCGVGVALLIASNGPALMFLGAVLVGLALGAEGDIAAYMISRYFPKHSYASVLGFVYFLFAMGSAAGVFLLGQVYGFTGSYGAGVVPIVAMVVVAIVCLLGMGSYRYSLDHRDLTDAESGESVTAGAQAARSDAEA